MCNGCSAVSSYTTSSKGSGRQAMFADNGTGRGDARQTMADLRRAVRLARAKDVADSYRVETVTLKTHWRKRGRHAESPARSRHSKVKAVVLPPMAKKVVAERELTEYDFIDGGRGEDDVWTGPDRPMADVWAERWEEMRYLWHRLRDAYKRDSMVLGAKLQPIIGAGKLDSFSMIRSLLVADKIVWTRSISQRFFMEEFTSYLSVDPFVTGTHLTRLWKALDVEETGTVDFRELACLLRLPYGVSTAVPGMGLLTVCTLVVPGSVLTHPGEAAVDKFMFFFDVYRQRLPSGLVKPFMLRQYLLFILGLPAASEDDAQALVRALKEVELAIGYPIPRAIHREKMLIALDDCPNAMATFRRCCLARLPRQRRLQALAHDASGKSGHAQWPAKSRFQARMRAAEARAAELGLPTDKFRMRQPRSRRLSTASVALAPVQAWDEGDAAARAFGVPETLQTVPRDPVDKYEANERARRQRALYSSDKNEVVKARVQPRISAAVNNVKAIAYSTMGTIAAMRGLTMVKLRLQRAGLCAVFQRYPTRRALMHFIFHHWRKRSQDKIRRLQDQNLAGEYYVNRLLIKYLRWWRFMGRVGAARQLADRMFIVQRKKKMWAAWRNYVQLQEMLRKNKLMFRDAAIRRLAMRAELAEADRELLFRKMWLPKVFAAIRAEARHWRVTRWAAEYRHWRLLRNQFTTWAQRAVYRREYKNRRRIERSVERHAEAERVAAEEAAEKAAEAARKAAEEEAAAAEAAWQEKLRKAEMYFDIRRVMEIQKEKADKKRRLEKEAREAAFNAHFDTIVAARYAEVARQADVYLQEDENGKRELKAWMAEMNGKLFIKEKIDETVQRWQDGFHWKLEFEWRLLARSFVHKDTEQRVYHRKETGVARHLRMSRKLMKQIARDNYVGRKQFECAAVLAQRRVKELALEHRRVSAIKIQKTWKTSKYSWALRQGLKALLERARQEAADENTRMRNEMAAKIQNAWRARGFQSMLADLVWSLWAIKSDPSDNSTYYMNRLSGAVQVHPPAILKSRLVGNVIRNIDLEPDWILVIVPEHERGVNHYFNPRSKEKRFKPPMGYYMCADCNRFRFATRFCPQCGDHYCAQCYQQQHKKGARANHAWIPIPVKPVFCKNCNRRKALFKCYECNMPLCYDCNKEFHHDTEWHDHDVIDL